MPSSKQEAPSFIEVEGKMFDVARLDPESPTWDQDVRQLREQLGAPKNPTLLPYHFLARTFPKIGGEIIALSQNDKPIVYGFAFPRQDGGYHLRRHPDPTIHPAYVPHPDTLAYAVSQYFRELGICGDDTTVVGYDPAAGHMHRYAPPSEDAITRPTRTQAQRIRLLQETIWGSPRDQLYPHDIHSSDWGGPSLVYQYQPGGDPAGCAFGFWSRCDALPAAVREVVGDQAIMQESQLVGVLPTDRQGGVADKLKRAQRTEALKQGVRVMSWTVDPLLSVNNHINLGKLGGCAMVFHKNYYPFENELNRVPASRFELVWMLDSSRVEDRLGTRRPVIDMNALFERDDILLVNRTGSPVEIQRPNDAPFYARPIDTWFHPVDDARHYRAFAVEIPAEWVLLQQYEIGMAKDWREVTDEIFQQHVGTEDGAYMMTDAAAVKDENGNVVRAFLLGQPSSAENLARVAQGKDFLSRFRSG